MELQRRKDLEAALVVSRPFVVDEWYSTFKESLRALHQGTVMDFHSDYMNNRVKAYDEDKAVIHHLLVQSGTDAERFWRSVEAEAIDFQLAAGETIGEYRRRILAFKREEKEAGLTEC